MARTVLPGGADGQAGEFFGDPQAEVADLAGEVLDGQVGGGVGDADDDGRSVSLPDGEGEGDGGGASALVTSSLVTRTASSARSPRPSSWYWPNSGQVGPEGDDLLVVTGMLRGLAAMKR